MNRIAVILPAYNEELTIRDTILEFYKYIPEASIYIINNRSSDATESIANSTLEELGCNGKVINELRPGKGNAVRRAFMEIDADVYILSDADLTYPADRVRDLMAPILEGRADLVVGDRHTSGHYEKENKRKLHGFGNRLVRDLVNNLFNANLSDIMSGYRVFNRRFIKNYPILVEGFEIETDMTLHALDKRFRVLEIPIDYKDRPEGSVSKLNTYTDGAKVIYTIASILRYYKPFLFFTSFAIIFGLLGFIAAIPVFDDWLTSQYIYHVPLAILATGLEMVAMLMFSIGLILDSNARQGRYVFELGLLHNEDK